MSRNPKRKNALRSSSRGRRAEKSRSKLGGSLVTPVTHLRSTGRCWRVDTKPVNHALGPTKRRYVILWVERSPHCELMVDVQFCWSIIPFIAERPVRPSPDDHTSQPLTLSVRGCSGATISALLKKLGHSPSGPENERPSPALSELLHRVRDDAHIFSTSSP